MTWLEPIEDLQKFLSDQETDKLRYRKRVLGFQNGINTIFKTFEFRRVTDFTIATGNMPEGVYVDGVKAAIISDNNYIGEFELQTAPSGNQELVATYYIQWFTESELQLFLKDASNSLSLSDSYDQIPGGLRLSALNFASSSAYQKLSLRWSDTMGDVYRLQDAPNDDESPLEKYSKMAAEFRDIGIKLRDDYYKRQGRPNSPLHGTLAGRISAVTPNK